MIVNRLSLSRDNINTNHGNVHIFKSLRVKQSNILYHTYLAIETLNNYLYRQTV